ncbi:uncharacterized protein LOC116848507 [Odontomachus brunneus]|uniref:uncharacterized protein LOC116848507 n=1 Tax=Odontomachus brunneus TaxID=486640 RepID=UPI0013F211E2|nr:uncharacterized protein LOC116848507 [Odontomachus brunneus]
MDNSVDTADDHSEDEALTSCSEIFEENPTNINEFLRSNDKKEMYLLRNLRKWAMKGVQYFVGRTISQGNDWQCAMYLVSKLLINNKLARVISWGGTKDTKISLSNSKIMEAVYCAVLKNHPKSDLKLVKTKVQRWLYTGNQRKV